MSLYPPFAFASVFKTEQQKESVLASLKEAGYESGPHMNFPEDGNLKIGKSSKLKYMNIRQSKKDGFYLLMDKVRLKDSFDSAAFEVEYNFAKQILLKIQSEMGLQNV